MKLTADSKPFKFGVKAVYTTPGFLCIADNTSL